MSGFSDTFTKEQQKDDVLGYDDAAFYYFAGSILLVIAVPWSFSVFYNILFPGEAQIEQDFPKKSKAGSTYKYCGTAAMKDKIDEARRKARQCSNSAVFGTVAKFAILGAMWFAIFLVAVKLESNEIKSFDPFQILEVSSGADNAAIKKAYRKLSLIYHPDKNPDDPLAQSRFIQITKAYQALTDETAKANYEKYGNPDGPQTSKVGIGLPGFLLEKDNHLVILCMFFFLLLFVVPMVFMCYWQRTKQYAANGVMIETLQFLGHYVGESTRVKNCPELLAASAESRAMPMRPTDDAAMKPLMQLVEAGKPQWPKVPPIVKNSTILWAHMQRLHDQMTPEIREDLDQLLRYSMKITQAMVEIACVREWFNTAQAMIEFRACLVQGLDVKSPQMLQIPHFTDDILKKHVSRGKNAVTKIHDFLSKDPEQRKGVSDFTPQQLADVEAFAAHFSQVALTGKVEVEDEDELVVGDIATVTATLTRKNLQEGEAIGPVHAPFFPEPKFEEWWIFLTEGAGNRIIQFERIRETERVAEVKMRFQISRPGKYSFQLHALCDSYTGLDQKFDLSFTAKTEDEVRREIIMHKEDEELDLMPTLFQQMMGELNKDEDSDEEEEDTGKDRKGQRANLTTGKDSDEADTKDAASDSDDSSSSSDSDGDN